MYTLFPADHSRRNWSKHDSQLAPFTEDSIDFYPHLLINYDYQKDEEPIGERHIPRKDQSTSKWVNGELVTSHSERHVELIADSGGFQGASVGRDVDPVACMQWQNRNSDIAFIVDKIPIRHPGDGTTLSFGAIASQITALTPTDEYFIECAEKTAVNLDIAMKYQDGPLLYSIIQGHDYATKKKWYEIVSKDHTPDGFGIKATSMEEMVASFTVITENFPDVPVHFLGCGSLSRIAPLIYFSKIHKARVTSDASSHLQGTKSRLYIDPITHDKWRILPDDKPALNPGDINGLTELPCLCKACKFGNENGIDRNSSMFGRILTLHNLRMMVDLSDKLDAMKHRREFFDDALRNYRCETSVLDAIDRMADDIEAVTASTSLSLEDWL